MLTFIKLGGSLITDKRESQHFHSEVMRRVADEIARALKAQPDMKLLIGHGSGSFGHVAAQKYGTMQGVRTPEQWRGFAEVATIARRLNTLVIETFYETGLPVIGFQPSSSARSENGVILSMEVGPIAAALDHGLIPLVYGDVSFDTVRGGTIISTETEFQYLAQALRPDRMMLLGDVAGVYDADGAIIPHITPGTFGTVAGALGGSRGTDVTGGMAAKVRQMLDLTAQIPGLQVRIFGGQAPGQIEDALLGRVEPGTLITV